MACCAARSRSIIRFVSSGEVRTLVGIRLHNISCCVDAKIVDCRLSRGNDVHCVRTEY